MNYKEPFAGEVALIDQITSAPVPKGDILKRRQDVHSAARVLEKGDWATPPLQQGVQIMRELTVRSRNATGLPIRWLCRGCERSTAGAKGKLHTGLCSGQIAYSPSQSISMVGSTPTSLTHSLTTVRTIRNGIYKTCIGTT